MALPSLEWIAGFFDGEGCVNTQKPYKDCKSRLLRVSIAQCDRSPLEELKILFGGSISCHKRAIEGSNHRDCFTWKVSAQKAEDFLTAIRPYVRVKRLQVEAALQLRLLVHSRELKRCATGWLCEKEDSNRISQILHLAQVISFHNGRNYKKLYESSIAPQGVE